MAAASQIKGLFYIPDFITEEEEAAALIEEIDSRWLEDQKLSRRTQHYGYEYNYSSATVDTKAEEFPPMINKIAQRLTPVYMQNIPEQCIVNEYKSGQGIAPHIDSSNFGPEIVTLSLLSTVTFRMQKPGSADGVELRPEPRSIIVLRDEARKKWQHGIKPVKNDVLANGQEIARSRRVSVTFRTIKKK